MAEIINLREQAYFRKIAARLQAIEAEQEIAECNFKLGHIDADGLKQATKTFLDATLAVRDEFEKFKGAA